MGQNSFQEAARAARKKPSILQARECRHASQAFAAALAGAGWRMGLRLGAAHRPAAKP
ncbi:hypothetical protein [Comamonas serinivorans]|uniref:hypothetical protein n=1 Tax=Comamonas serinivorans TaxID=1082851 RepID=UPI0012FC17D3|nr:hypothetical protein [Comamonas serinivorans]